MHQRRLNWTQTFASRMKQAAWKITGCDFSRRQLGALLFPSQGLLSLQSALISAFLKSQLSAGIFFPLLQLKRQRRRNRAASPRNNPKKKNALEMSCSTFPPQPHALPSWDQGDGGGGDGNLSRFGSVVVHGGCLSCRARTSLCPSPHPSSNERDTPRN